MDIGRLRLFPLIAALLTVACGDLSEPQKADVPVPARTTTNTAPKASSATPTPSPTSQAVTITVGGTTIQLQNRDQADLVQYYFRLQSVLRPADENVTSLREVSQLASNGHVSTHEYYRFLLQARDSLRSLASSFLTVRPPSALSEVHFLYVSALDNRGDALDHFARATDAGSLEERRKAETDIAESDRESLQATLGLYETIQRAGLNFEVLTQMVSCDPKARRCSLSAPSPPDALTSPVKLDPVVTNNMCLDGSGQSVGLFRYRDSLEGHDYVIGRGGERLTVPDGAPIPPEVCKRALNLP